METMLSIIAISVSLVSLGVSIFVVRRDRSNLVAECTAFKHDETDEYSHLCIKAVNKGRRPVILLYLMGVYTEGEKSGYLLENDGLKLEEGAYREERIGKFDGMMVHTGRYGEKNCQLRDLYLEDSAGRQYPIKDAKKSISQLWASKHPLGIRTHS